MTNSKPTFKRRSRRSGVSTYLFAASFPVIVGLAGFVIDMGNLYTKRAQAQRAADAAALAGAIVSGGGDAAAINEAEKYAALNGYSAARGAVVTVEPRVGGKAGVVGVNLVRPETVFFMPIMETLLNLAGNPSLAAQYSRNVGAYAIAEKIVSNHEDLGGNYGTVDGPSNPSAFGPYAPHDYGDPYSTKYYLDGSLNDGSKSGDLGGGHSDTGFDYTLKVTDDYIASGKKVQLQIFDPECYNSGGDSFDEIRDPTPNLPSEAEYDGNRATKTRYELFKDNGGGSLTPIASAEYRDDKTTNESWVTPDQNGNFLFDPATYGPGNYKIRVKTTDGSSENGYNLRAGPPEGADLPDTDWNDKYGDKAGVDPSNIAVPITADDKLQMNFTKSGPVQVRLGYVPAEAAGRDLTITMFDTDIGAVSIDYTTDADPSFKQVGSLPPLNARDDVWNTNTINVPADFKGGYFYANYMASKGDTSSWALAYAGAGPGTVKLIR